MGLEGGVTHMELSYPPASLPTGLALPSTVFKYNVLFSNEELFTCFISLHILLAVCTHVFYNFPTPQKICYTEYPFKHSLWMSLRLLEGYISQNIIASHRLYIYYGP